MGCIHRSKDNALGRTIEKEFEVNRFLAIMLALLLVGCGSSKEKSETQKAASEQKAEPDYVTVQHILIGFSGSVPGKKIDRTREEAATLAEDVLRRALAGEDFDAVFEGYIFPVDGYVGFYGITCDGGLNGRNGGGCIPPSVAGRECWWAGPPSPR